MPQGVDERLATLGQEPMTTNERSVAVRRLVAGA